MKYGLPYKGGKGLIAEKIFSELPWGKRFVDLFGGGGAMSHYAMLSLKYDSVLYNELNPDVCQLFDWAIHGKFKGETRWISREDFFRLKDTDPYVRNCWSFGNDNRTYCYGRTIEPYKKACHYAVVLDEWTEFERLCPEVVDAAKAALDGLTDTHERRIAFGPAIVKELKRLGDWETVEGNPLYLSCHKKPATGDATVAGRLKDLQNLQRLQSLERLESLQSLESLESLERLQSLQSLERLQRLESLESLERKLTITNGSYEEYVYKEGDVVYCDPPYEGTSDYSEHGAGSFDSQRFYDWALSQPYTIYISSYELPPAFTLIKEIPKISSLGNNHTITERLYTNRNTGRSWMRQMYFDFGD